MADISYSGSVADDSLTSQTAQAENNLKNAAEYAKEIKEALDETVKQLKELNEAEKTRLKTKKEESKLDQLNKEYQKLEDKHFEKKSKFSINFIKAAKENAERAKNDLETEKRKLQIQEDILKAQKEQGEESNKILETEEKIKQLRESVSSGEKKAVATQRISDMAGTIVNATKSAVNGIIDKIDSNLSVYSQYVGKVTARLQSLDSSSAKSFDTIYNKMAGLSTSQYVSQKTLYENIDRLSSEGISYNIEERAFLASLADKMVNSFDVSNATLTRLIRLYQEDFTQAMLGSEAWLTQVFNMMYEDTSYLKNVDDNILSALTEVMSTMDRSDALTFQYEVQKWLGSMYEVGMSSDAISQLASALNALGTGNAAGFESSGVGTLLNLAIARSNYSLADILTQGLTGEAANEILKSVVELLIDIKDNTSNQATLNAYANVMGVSMADIRGAYNLKSDIPYLYNQTMTLDAAEDEIYNQLIEIKYNRTAMQERIDNLIDNLAVGIATSTAKSDTGYLTWLLGKSLVNIGSQIPGLVGAGVSIAGYLPLLANVANGIKTINSSSLGWMSTADTGYDNAVNAEGTKAGILGIFNEIGSFISNAASPTVGDLIGFLTGNTKRSVISQRGNAYGIVKPNYGTVSTNISSSYGYSGITSTEDLYNGTVLATNAPTSGLQNLETLASQSGFGYDVFSTESNNEGYNEYDIIQELFYHQEHPIKVHLAYFDEDAEKQLIDYINNQDNNDQLQKIRGKVEGTIRVDTEEFGAGDIQRIITAVQSAG